MKKNRVHYTNAPTPKAPTIASKNCFNSVLIGHKASKQSISILALLALVALFAKLKDI